MFSRNLQMDVSKNRGTPKSSILIGFSVKDHPFWGTPIFGSSTKTSWIPFRIRLWDFPQRISLGIPTGLGFQTLLQHGYPLSARLRFLNHQGVSTCFFLGIPGWNTVKNPEKISPLDFPVGKSAIRFRQKPRDIKTLVGWLVGWWKDKSDTKQLLFSVFRKASEWKAQEVSWCLGVAKKGRRYGRHQLAECGCHQTPQSVAWVWGEDGWWRWKQSFRNRCTVVVRCRLHWLMYTVV